MNNFDDLKLATEAMTGGKDTVLLDDVGMPSIMVVIPKMNSKDLVIGATDEVHPAFMVNGVEKDKVYISKYINIVNNNRAYSLPMQDPYASVNFNDAVAYCRNKGNGWGLMPASLWAAIALWCKKNKTQPRGNDNYGSNKTYTYESGVATTKDSSGRTNHTATGSGPVTWNHDFTDAGICDLNGNVSEWNAGIRLIGGELQVIPYANCMMANIDMSDTSSAWMYIGLDGGYTRIENHIKFNFSSSDNKLTWDSNIGEITSTAKSQTFSGLAASENINSSGKIMLRKLALLPEESDTDYNNATLYCKNDTGEYLPYRGGHYSANNGGNIFYFCLSYARSYASQAVGFRSVYYDL